MREGFTKKGENETGNTIYTFDARPELGEIVFVGNNGYSKDYWGKFTIQVENDADLWNELENGLYDTEVEAKEMVEALIADGFDADAISYEQI